MPGNASERHRFLVIKRINFAPYVVQYPQATFLGGVCEEYLWILDRFLRCGIRVLAHPFRLFRRLQIEPPAELFRPTVRMLRESGVAAEVNFHMNEPPQEFVYMCIESGVKLTLGSDAHSLYEVGELAPHLELLRSLGYDEGISDIVAQPAGAVGGEDGS